MDRIDEVLLIFPFLPVADLLSTLFSLRFGGEEVGILARPILENYGSVGLVMLAASGSIIFLICMLVVIHIKKLFVWEFRFKWTSYVLFISIYWIFMLEGVYFSTIILNFLVPLSLSLIQTMVLKALLMCIYFMCLKLLTKSRMKQLAISKSKLKFT